MANVSVPSVFLANNQILLAKELIIAASMQRKDRIYRSRLEAVVDPTNKRMWLEVLTIAKQWGVEIHD